jgi:hypothetical protein
VSTVAAIVTAQPVVREPQLPGVPGVVTGILRANTGLPLEGIRIAVTPADQSIPVDMLERNGLAGLTDSAGRYRLEDIPAGRYNILIGQNSTRYHPGVADLGRATTIQVAGSTVEVADMVVNGGQVTGRVVDMATGKGRRIEDLVLCCDYFKPVLGTGTFNPVIGNIFVPTISDDGSFVFPFVPPGNYFLAIADSNFVRVSWALGGRTAQPASSWMWPKVSRFTEQFAIRLAGP